MTNDAAGDLAQRIRERMDALGLNPFSAAQRAGLGEAYVRDILRGKSKNPSADKLGKLAVALETSLTYLISGDEPILNIQVSPGNVMNIPKPFASATSPPDLVPVSLPIKHELLFDIWRNASQMTRAPIGYEAATIIDEYKHREQWFELVRDNSMRAVAPSGSLVQVAAMGDDDVRSLEHGDIVVVQKRVISTDRKIHVVNRSLRRIEFYEDLGVWLYSLHTGDPSMDFTEELAIGSDSNPSLSEYLEWRAKDPPFRELKFFPDQDEQGRPLTPAEQEMAQGVSLEMEAQPISLVAKALRVLIPIDRRSGFGIADRDISRI